MSGSGANIAKSANSGDAARDWEAVRQSADIQFAPIPPIQPPKAPAWMEWVSKMLDAIFGPVAEVFSEALKAVWPWLQYAMIGVAALLAIFVLWRVLMPLLHKLREYKATTESWAPTREQALALLSDADALARNGHYGEAVHLLLLRSVGQIKAAQPHAFVPANTAREIANLPQLSHDARLAFSKIAGGVEQSLFALREIDDAGWSAAREAYADFALADLAAQPVEPNDASPRPGA